MKKTSPLQCYDHNVFSPLQCYDHNVFNPLQCYDHAERRPRYEIFPRLHQNPGFLKKEAENQVSLND